MTRLGRVAAILVVLLGLGVLATGCGSTEESSAGPSAAAGPGGEVVRLWIGPELADCVGVAPMQCMQVSYSEGGESQLFYDAIEGFEYVEGTLYVVDVQVTDVENPPADASSKKYTLVEVVSETSALGSSPSG